MQRAPRPRQMLAPVALQHLAPRLPTLVDRLLCWLALYPFQPARSLLLALRTTPATLYRHIARASQQQLI